jgi:hypothetical protein
MKHALPYIAVQILAVLSYQKFPMLEERTCTTAMPLLGGFAETMEVFAMEHMGSDGHAFD